MWVAYHHHLSSFTHSAAITTTELDHDYQTSPDQRLFKLNNDQLESSYLEPCQDLIPSSSSSSSNQFNYQSTNSSPSQLTQSVAEQKAFLSNNKKQQQQQQGRVPLSRPNSSSFPGPNLAQYPAPTLVPTAPLPLYKFSVGNPQKIGMKNDIHTVYTVRTVAMDPRPSVPPIPDKNLRHWFQEGFIAARRVALELFLQKTVNNPMLTLSSAVVPEAAQDPHPSLSTPDPTVENLTRDLNLNRDHESSLSPSESHHQHDVLQEQQSLIVPDDAAVWADMSKSDPSPPSSSQLENHTGLPSHDHEDHPSFHSLFFSSFFYYNSI
ncbi:Vacuolar protein sorting-associated protein 5 [Puccinia graminis f. sp. tritici]|uniref:Vacuolar protein sorting-associated protein 5 n=1 Tax=Puccinia graminis f. sp. tritici TaxID=56615 RepID=A0A5B0NLM1_PUCGR|nr:Vacuolar protein sorting-associated protein 5 [Puccinia graminis f. sp. tritici]